MCKKMYTREISVLLNCLQKKLVYSITKNSKYLSV